MRYYATEHLKFYPHLILSKPIVQNKGPPCRLSLSKEDSIHFTVFPLCRALIVLVDRFELDALSSDHSDVHDYVGAFQYAREETVLLVRTGDESGLSAPIDFEDVKSQCCPLEFQDLPAGSSDVIRATVSTAVEFITRFFF